MAWNKSGRHGERSQRHCLPCLCVLFERGKTALASGSYVMFIGGSYHWTRCRDRMTLTTRVDPSELQTILVRSDYQHSRLTVIGPVWVLKIVSMIWCSRSPLSCKRVFRQSFPAALHAYARMARNGMPESFVQCIGNTKCGVHVANRHRLRAYGSAQALSFSG